MTLAAERDMIARQYANGFRDVLGDALPALCRSLDAGWPLETAIVSCYLSVLARNPDSLIARKHGSATSCAVSRRAGELLDTGWPEGDDARARLEAFDSWLRQPSNGYNPGTTADLVTAALYAALRVGIIKLPLSAEN
jgi:triphosphoribosyl-dephospho-CoA synthase